MNVKQLLELTQEQKAIAFIVKSELKDYAKLLVKSLDTPEPLDVTLTEDGDTLILGVVCGWYSSSWRLVLSPEEYLSCGESFVKPFDALRYMKHRVLLDIAYNMVVTL